MQISNFDLKKQNLKSRITSQLSFILFRMEGLQDLLTYLNQK